MFEVRAFVVERVFEVKGLRQWAELIHWAAVIITALMGCERLVKPKPISGFTAPINRLSLSFCYFHFYSPLLRKSTL